MHLEFMRESERDEMKNDSLHLDYAYGNASVCTIAGFFGYYFYCFAGK